MTEFRLAIANVVVAVHFDTAQDAKAFGRYFGRKSVKRDADISLLLRYRRDAGPNAEVPNSLFLSKVGAGEGFSVAGGLITGRYSPASGEGELSVDRLIVTGGYARIFEQILYQAYWSAVRRKGVDSYLLHSGGAIRRGRGWGFCGKSGSGKSTSVSLSPWKARILNDEITAIDLSAPGTPVLRSTPFNGYFPRKKEGSAPLGGIMLLSQAPLHRLTRVDDVEAVKILSREVIPPMGLETPLGPKAYMEMFDCAERTRARAALYRMEFLPDPGFWDRIDEL